LDSTLTIEIPKVSAEFCFGILPILSNLSTRFILQAMQEEFELHGKHHKPVCSLAASPSQRICQVEASF